MLVNRACILLMSLAVVSCCGKEVKFSPTDIQTIQLYLSPVVHRDEFDQKVARSIRLLEQKPIIDFTAQQHIELMRLSNTIFVKGLKYGQNQQLETWMLKKDYNIKIAEIYPNWYPNLGMGMYFPQLQMELGGSPQPSSLFVVIE